MAQQKQGAQAPGETDLTANVPDALHPLLQGMIDNWKLLAGVAGGIVLAVALYSGYGLYQARQVASFQERLGLAMIENSGRERLEAARKLAEEAPSGAQVQALFAVARAAVEAGDNEAALDAYTELAAAGDSEIVAVAGLGRSATLLELGRAEDALAEAVALETRVPESYDTVILLQVAAAAEAAGDKDAALSAYRQLLEKQSPETRDYFEYRIERLSAASAS